MAEVIFWSSAAVLAYTYAGYHAVLRVLATVLPRTRAV